MSDDRDDRDGSWRSLMRAPHAVGDELEEELAFHFREAVESLMAEGRTREEAETEARRRFGDEDAYRRMLRSIDRSGRLRAGLRAVSSAVHEAMRDVGRGVARRPGLMVVMVLSFALGIGANATMYGTIDRLLLRPPEGIADADRVRRLYLDRFVPFIGERMVSTTFTYPDFEDLRGASSFAGVAGVAWDRLPAGRGTQAELVQTSSVTGDFWSLLGVQPAVGRFFSEAEDVRGGEPVAVLSYGYWRRQYGGDAGVLGRTLDLGAVTYTIIGVAPEGFNGIDLTPVDVWLPLRLTQYLRAGDGWQTNREWWWLHAVARLRDGVTAERAQEEASTIFRNGRSRFIAAGEEDAEPLVIPASLIAARGPAPPAEASVARWLLIVSGIVLLAACANVANLLLGRMLRQQRETAVRLALGISRGRLLAESLIAGSTIALIGALVAVVLAWWGGAYIRSALLPQIAWGAALSGRTILFVVGMAVAAGVLATLVPAAQALRTGVGGTLRANSGGVTRPGSRARSSLSAAQAAFSVILLVGAGLFVRSLSRVHALDLGFDATNVWYARVSLDRSAAADVSLDAAMLDERLASVPGVESAALSLMLPLTASWSIELRAEGIDSIPSLPSGGPYLYPVSPGFFETLDIELVEGRDFTTADRRGAPRAAIINRSMARALWPAQSALGRCLFLEGSLECTRIVGVVEDARRETIREGAQYVYYVPLAQSELDWPALPAVLVRARADDARTATALRTALGAVDPSVRYVDVGRFQSLLDPQTRAWRLGASLFSAFGALALLIAAIGLYAVLAFDVTQRRREIGLRAALGARRATIIGIVLSRAVRTVGAGLVVGLATALLLAGRLEPLLFQTSPHDPLTLTTVTLTLLLVALLAGAIPAWRATRIDPGAALRSE